MSAQPTIIKPQPVQRAFLSSPADIVIMGGGAGVGKSYALLIDPLRYKDVPDFGCVTFRRTMPQIKREGGLWDTSYKLYKGFGARPVESPILQWDFSKKRKGDRLGRFSFGHLQHEHTVKDWDGSQLTGVYFDELQHFTEKQFFYMLSRNRSPCGIRPYVRATCNPDPDSFLRVFLKWWINQETGFPILERSGVIRWLVRDNTKLFWADTKEELLRKFPATIPKSVTFIPGTVYDNPALLEVNPEYVGNLQALPTYEKNRLLGGNWFARPSAGELFARKHVKFINAEDVPEYIDSIRYWDRGATKPNDINPDPDATAGAHVTIDHFNRIFILNVKVLKEEPLEVEEAIEQKAREDGGDAAIGIEQDPGAAGKMEAQYYIRKLAGYNVQAFPKRTNKLTYWKPFAAQWKAGNVYIVRGAWNEDFLSELENVTDGSQDGHDDQADAVSGAFMVLTGQIESASSIANVNVI